MSAVVGLVGEDEQCVLYNCALLLHRGMIALAHRKIYLPSYGIFQEGRFFGEGRKLALAPLDGADGQPAGGDASRDTRQHPRLGTRSHAGNLRGDLQRSRPVEAERRFARSSRHD